MGQQDDKATAGATASGEAKAETAPLHNASHIRDLVRSGDQDRFWSALFASEPAQSSLLALDAFTIELSRIPDRISEPQLGEIRLQWWCDALHQAMETGRADHPVMAALADTARRHALALSELDAVIEARRFDLSDEPMQDRARLESYMDATTGAQFRLAAIVLGANPHDHERLIGAATKAYGLTALMRSLPHDASHGRIFLPADLLAAHGLHPNVILSGTDNTDLRAALRDLREEAERALGEARLHLTMLPRSLRPAFLPLAPLPAYIRALASPDLNPIREIVQLNPLRRYALIWRGYLTGRI